MKVALINENSQASKNGIIYNELKKVTDQHGYELVNYGMYGEEGESALTYVQVGLLTAILINSEAADFVVTGCGTGEGAMLACNSFPRVLCGHITDANDAFLFGQINNGNAIAMPYAQGFGWGGEINLAYTFEKLFEQEHGQGYPKDRVVPEQRNKKILDAVKEVTHTDMLTILKNIDQALLKETISGKHFQEYFFPRCKNQEIASYLKEVLAR